MTRLFIKIAVGIVALGVLGFVFVRSAQNTRAEPYEIARGRMTGWTLAIDADPNRSSVLLALRPQPEFAPALFTQVFARSGDSMHSPVPAQIPLLLQTEFDRPMADTFTPQALLDIARASGLESASPEPRCMAHRRVSQPGMVKQVFFVRFTSPAFETFRQRVATQLRSADGPASAFNPSALSPVLIVGAADAAFGEWLPLQATAEDDCLAPITVH